MARLLYFLRSALLGLRQAPFVHAVAALTIAVALLATAFARFGLIGADRVLASWGEDVEVTLYLKDGVTEEQARALAAVLVEESAVEARFVSADEALERLRVELGPDGEVLADLPRNPLSASLEIRPGPGGEELRGRAERWGGYAEVASVEYGREWVERLEQITRQSRSVGLVIFLSIVLAAVVVAAATLQLGIYSRRDEIAIQKLVGATDAFVRAPFLLEGALQGLLGAMVALGALLVIQQQLGPELAATFRFAAAGMGGLRLLDAATAGALTLLGVLLGFIGSLFAVGRFLRV